MLKELLGRFISCCGIVGHKSSATFQSNHVYGNVALCNSPKEIEVSEGLDLSRTCGTRIFKRLSFDRRNHVYGNVALCNSPKVIKVSEGLDLSRIQAYFRSSTGPGCPLITVIKRS